MKLLSSYYKIVVFELFATVVGKLRRKAKALRKPRLLESALNIDKFMVTPPRGHALMILSQIAWLDALRAGPGLNSFNAQGLTLEVVKAFNELGYLVDIVNMYNPDIVLPRNDYDAVFAHGPHCAKMIESLPPETLVIHYASGAYWREFNRMSKERYDEFAKRNNVPSAHDFVRSLSGTEAGEEYLARRADHTFLAGPRSVATFAGVCRHMQLLYLGAYIDHALRDIPKDFDAGRKNFIYVAGTGGNIQKGMDVLIEAFSETPDLNLYIYCMVEDEILRVYKDKLSLANIHYIYHLRYPIFKNQLARIFSKINFTITAPIDTGVGTAFIGSIGLGLIPVGYSDIEGSAEDSCLAADWSIPAIIQCLRTSSEKSADWCARAAKLNIEKYERLHNPSAFGANFKAYLARILNGIQSVDKKRQTMDLPSP